MKEVSDAARVLYEYMVEHHQVRFGTGGKHEVEMFIQIDERWKAHQNLLDELHKSRWIVKTGQSNIILVGSGVITRKPYRTSLTKVELIEILWSRYTDSQRSTIQSAFNAHCNRTGKKSLTELQIIDELDYYSRFKISDVMIGLRVYISLTDPKLLLPYARGIIRNQAGSEIPSPPIIHQSTNTTIRSLPTSSLTTKSQWIEQRLRELNINLSLLRDQEKLDVISSLEKEFEEIS